MYNIFFLDPLPPKGGMKTSDNQKVPLGGFRGVTKKIDF
jgi:hypothetical protein